MESGKLAKSEVEQLFKLLVQGDAQNQCQLCGGGEVSRLDGADGVAGHAHQFRQRRLTELSLNPGFLDAVFQDQLVVHGESPAQSGFQEPQNRKNGGKGKQDCEKPIGLLFQKERLIAVDDRKPNPVNRPDRYINGFGAVRNGVDHHQK